MAYAAALGAVGVTLGGSSPLPPIDNFHAGVAQLVERNLAKVDVTGSNPASRSRFYNPATYRGILLQFFPQIIFDFSAWADKAKKEVTR